MMAMKQVSLHTSNSATVGAHQRSQNIVHCVSLDSQYSIERALESEKGQSLHMQNIAVKSGADVHSKYACARHIYYDLEAWPVRKS